jgi:hypothetical protein
LSVHLYLYFCSKTSKLQSWSKIFEGEKTIWKKKKWTQDVWNWKLATPKKKPNTRRTIENGSSCFLFTTYSGQPLQSGHHWKRYPESLRYCFALTVLVSVFATFCLVGLWLSFLSPAFIPRCCST